jgi:hypothetical protein
MVIFVYRRVTAMRDSVSNCLRVRQGGEPCAKGDGHVCHQGLPQFVKTEKHTLKEKYMISFPVGVITIPGAITINDDDGVIIKGENK